MSASDGPREAGQWSGKNHHRRGLIKTGGPGQLLDRTGYGRLAFKTMYRRRSYRLISLAFIVCVKVSGR
jgi:hypothetical protein